LYSGGSNLALEADLLSLSLFRKSSKKQMPEKFFILRQIACFQAISNLMFTTNSMGSAVA
jgi:hypothetical protein